MKTDGEIKDGVIQTFGHAETPVIIRAIIACRARIQEVKSRLNKRKSKRHPYRLQSIEEIEMRTRGYSGKARKLLLQTLIRARLTENSFQMRWRQLSM
jgi:hypothetical protein